MTRNNQLALLISYYLSRCDKDAYKNLGYSSFSQAVNDIGKILNVKSNTLRNMRDEFDPYHNNQRIGWKRDLAGSRLKVLNAFQDTDDDTLLEIVKEILTNKEFKNTEEYNDIQTLFQDKLKEAGRKTRAPVFILRGPTGKAAENFFMEYFKNNGKPVEGELIDIKYEVPSDDYFKNPRKKDGDYKLPYLRFTRNKELQRFPNGFVVFTPYAFINKKKEIDKILK